LNPRSDWFKCESCGTLLRYEQDQNGVPYLQMGRVINGQIIAGTRTIMRIIEQEGQQTRAEMRIHQEIDKLGFDRLAQVNYLVYLALQRAEFREQIRDVEKRPTNQQNPGEISTLRSKIGAINRRIETIDDKVRPDKEAPKKPSSSSNDALIVGIVIIALIAVIAIIAALAK
jgi:hypothetical protein